MTAVLTRPNSLSPVRKHAVSSADWDVLRRAPLFKGIDEAVVNDLRPALQISHVRARDSLFRKGDAGDRLFIVIDGKIKITARHNDGRQTLLSVLGAADQFGELSLFDPGPRTATAVALTNATVASVTKDDLQQWMTAHPYITMRLLQVLARRLRRTNSVITDLMFVDVSGRVAKQLLLLAKRFGSAALGEMSVEHELSQADLAQLVGASRETVNKTLSNFSERGWIKVGPRSVVILQPQQLARRAGRTT